VLDDFESAPIEKPLRRTLRFLSRLALEPRSVTAEDVRPVLEAGVSREAVRDAIYVCYLFTTYTRLADSLGWALLDDAGYQATARHLLTRGY
jgi:hypothetical protein